MKNTINEKISILNKNKSDAEENIETLRKKILKIEGALEILAILNSELKVQESSTESKKPEKTKGKGSK